MSLISRKAQPGHPCRLYQGELGCFTTGWQDYVELAAAVDRWIDRDAELSSAVQRLFKEHARSMPRFLLSGYEHESFDYDAGIVITTECSSGAPTWDLNRSGKYGAGHCNLYTRISHI